MRFPLHHQWQLSTGATVICRVALACVASLFALNAAAENQTTALRIGAEDDAAPWSYSDGTGYANDVVKAAFAAANVAINLEVVPYARYKHMAIGGEFVACFTASKSPDLDGKLVFTETPLINPHFLAFTLANSPLIGCDSPAWQQSPRIAYVRGYEYTAAQEALRNSGSTSEVTSETIALKMLSFRRVDVAMVNLDAVKTLDMVLAPSGLPHNETKKITLACDFGSQGGYLAFSAKHPGTSAAMVAFEQGMTALQASGELESLQKTWAARALGLVTKSASSPIPSD